MTQLYCHYLQCWKVVLTCGGYTLHVLFVYLFHLLYLFFLSPGSSEGAEGVTKPLKS